MRCDRCQAVGQEITQVPFQLSAGHDFGTGGQEVNSDGPDAAAQVGTAHDDIGLDREDLPTGPAAVERELARRTDLHVVRFAERLRWPNGQRSQANRASTAVSAGKQSNSSVRMK